MNIQSLAPAVGVKNTYWYSCHCPFTLLLWNWFFLSGFCIVLSRLYLCFMSPTSNSSVYYQCLNIRLAKDGFFIDWGKRWSRSSLQSMADLALAPSRLCLLPGMPYRADSSYSLMWGESLKSLFCADICSITFCLWLSLWSIQVIANTAKTYLALKRTVKARPNGYLSQLLSCVQAVHKPRGLLSNTCFLLLHLGTECNPWEISW